jgi:predicted N-acyltransferase
MQIVFTNNISSVNSKHWYKLCGDSNPFIQHDFLNALEQHDCLQNWGWLPNHCLLYDNETLIGACPAYIKNNSYGEFVFDWAWADAYHQHGLDYYPKLVTAIPYTPVQGPRLLASVNYRDANGRLIDAATIKKTLLTALIEFAEKNDLSSAHFLFCESDDINILSNADLMLRFDYQYHWPNHNYQSFDDFLSQLTSKRRKNIKRERKTITDNNIAIRIVHGQVLTDEQWNLLYNYYQITFLKKSGTATLTLDFFKAVAHKLLAFLAYHENKIVAAAICFKGKDKLYGRHWGCREKYNNLHFELCYYTGIDYCISNQLQGFEPGAQGEHKIWRGFLPVKTQSAHWIAHPAFKNAIRDYLQREAVAMDHHGELLLESSPYKST